MSRLFAAVAFISVIPFFLGMQRNDSSLLAVSIAGMVLGVVGCGLLRIFIDAK